MNAAPSLRSGIPPSRTSPSCHSVSNHPRSLEVAFPLSAILAPFIGFPRRLWMRPRPCADLSAPQVFSQASPLASRLAGPSGRIEFVLLRTGRSPSVASHPASRRRSYGRLQNYDAILEWTRTTLTSYARRRTSTGILPVICGQERGTRMCAARGARRLGCGRRCCIVNACTAWRGFE